MTPTSRIGRLRNALPFWLSLALLPMLALAAYLGNLALLLPPLGTWWIYSVLDQIFGLNEENPDPQTEDNQLFWYRLITLIWFPIQLIVIYGTLYYAIYHAPHLAMWEKIWLFLDVGILTGTVGIVYSHELMHQKNRLERWLADLLLATVLYSHFRSEHLQVHHIYVATPRDAVSARYNETFYAFFLRVLPECLISAWTAEKVQLARRKKTVWDGGNPFWRYAALQVLFIAIAIGIGGWQGLLLFVLQALSAIFQLELTNYVEHYGLTRKYLGDGKYERVMPRHSWNAAHKASNWLLINLQRHSDHHYKPSRRFPLLQTYSETEAPQLPFGYPLMTLAACVPPLWLRIMNPRVREWRLRFYPEITNWAPYRTGAHPAPA